MVVILLWRDKFNKTCTATDYDVWRDKTSVTTRTGEKFRVWCEHTVRGELSPALGYVIVGVIVRLFCGQ